MKTKKLFLTSVALILLAAIIMPLIALTNLTAHAESNVLLINEKRTVYLGEDEVQAFYFTPEDDKMYVVETFGNCRTVLLISNFVDTTITTYKGGQGENARIYFKGNPATQYKIEVRHYSEIEEGTFQIQVRKQKFAMFGYIGYKDNGKEDINTLPDLNVPYNVFSNTFDCVKYENVNASKAFSYDERNLPVMDSELFFFSGHGYDNGSGVPFYNETGKVGDIKNSYSINMTSTRVALWSACCSASGKNDRDISIAEYAVSCGAKASIGFKHSILTSSAKKFSDKFFTDLAEGKTVEEAASAAAKTGIWIVDTINSYVIFGKGDFNVTDRTQSIGNFSLRPQDYDYYNSLFNSYICDSIGGNEYRYYEPINGYPSSNYFDAVIENESIVNVDDHCSDYNCVLDINDKYLSAGLENSFIKDGEKFNLITEEEEYIVYYNFDGVMTPVKITYFTAEDENGNSVYDADCINLNNGTKIDYATIS